MSGGWRGRAQQIVMLKAKVRRLEGGGGGGGGGTLSKGGGVDSQAEADLAGMGEERRHLVAALVAERDRLQEHLLVQEKRQAALKARNHYLESEVAQIKDNLKVVLAKSDTDDQLHVALRQEVARLKDKITTLSSQVAAPKTTTSTTTSFPEDLNREVIRLGRLVVHQSEQIDSQVDTIRQLKSQLERERR